MVLFEPFETMKRLYYTCFNIRTILLHHFLMVSLTSHHSSTLPAEIIPDSIDTLLCIL